MAMHSRRRYRQGRLRWGPWGAELESQQQRDRWGAQRAQRDTFRKYTCCQSMPLKKMCSFTSCALGKRRETESCRGQTGNVASAVLNRLPVGARRERFCSLRNQLQTGKQLRG